MVSPDKTAFMFQRHILSMDLSLTVLLVGLLQMVVMARPSGLETSQ